MCKCIYYLDTTENPGNTVGLNKQTKKKTPPYSEQNCFEAKVSIFSVTSFANMPNLNCFGEAVLQFSDSIYYQTFFITS